MIPLGDWGAGWGLLCIDLSKPEEAIDENEPLTWSLVWFDHGNLPELLGVGL